MPGSPEGVEGGDERRAERRRHSAAVRRVEVEVDEVLEGGGENASFVLGIKRATACLVSEGDGSEGLMEGIPFGLPGLKEVVELVFTEEVGNSMGVPTIVVGGYD